MQIGKILIKTKANLSDNVLDLLINGVNKALSLYWRLSFVLFKAVSSNQPPEFKAHLMIVFYDEQNTERLEEYKACIQWNVINPYIDHIHLFYENRKHEIPAWLTNKKITIYDYRAEHSRAMTYGQMFEFANKHLQGEIVAIANTDIYFDRSLSRLKNYDLTNKVLALTRYNRGIYGSHGRKIWKRAAWSQDSWIFKSPLRSFNGNIFIGWKGCDNRLAYELDKAGIRVINPSKDIKTWHYHRASSRSYVASNQSYVHEKDFRAISAHIPISKL